MYKRKKPTITLLSTISVKNTIIVYRVLYAALSITMAVQLVHYDFRRLLSNASIMWLSMFITF